MGSWSFLKHNFSIWITGTNGLVLMWKMESLTSPGYTNPAQKGPKAGNKTWGNINRKYSNKLSHRQISAGNKTFQCEMCIGEITVLPRLSISPLICHIHRRRGSEENDDYLLQTGGGREKMNSFNMHGGEKVTQVRQRTSDLLGNNEQRGANKFATITVTDEVN